MSTGTAERPKFTPKRERTRRQLIDTAAEMIAEKGFGGVSLREVAARAGLTKGAIYGIFESKEDLFLAVVQTKLPRRVGTVFERGLPLREQMHRYARLLTAAAPAIQSSARLAMEFDAYLASNPEMRARARTEIETRHRETAEELLAAVDPGELPMPAHEFAVLLASLTGGLMYRRMIMPDVVTDEFILKSFELLAQKPAANR
ncbi:MAG: TetR family transcriptional regulator [Alphaproteobacteria bacterium]